MRTKETRNDLRDGLLKKKRRRRRIEFKLALVLMQLLFRMDYFTDTKRKIERGREGPVLSIGRALIQKQGAVGNNRQ